MMPRVPSFAEHEVESAEGQQRVCHPYKSWDPTIRALRRIERKGGISYAHPELNVDTHSSAATLRMEHAKLRVELREKEKEFALHKLKMKEKRERRRGAHHIDQGLARSRQ